MLVYETWRENCLEVLVVEHFKTAVGNQHLRHTDAFGHLVVLNDSGHNAR